MREYWVPLGEIYIIEDVPDICMSKCVHYLMKSSISNSNQVQQKLDQKVANQDKTSSDILGTKRSYNSIDSIDKKGFLSMLLTYILM